ncbi:MAG: hypothetical protein JSU87_06700 [Gemmatimonadota bacterium]|nr:MAG: hypothetical protein JSU87_06700 [Gemmatimonadota bacterium]
MNRTLNSRRAPDPKTSEPRDRARRWLLLAQGGYYLLTGLWPLVHLSSFAQIVALRINPFQAQSYGAVLIVIGACLIEAARRGPPDAFATLLGAAVAAAIAVVDLVWLPRLGVTSGLWFDLLVEVAFAVALILFYPRVQARQKRSSSRRQRL